MKKAFYLLVFPIFILGIFSCTPQVVLGDSEVPQACCGDDFQVPPTPPKPPIGG